MLMSGSHSQGFDLIGFKYSLDRRVKKKKKASQAIAVSIRCCAMITPSCTAILLGLFSETDYLCLLYCD